MTTSITETGLIVLAAVLALPGCSDPPCENRTVQTIRSPDGAHQAVVFARECGATVATGTNVSVDPGPEDPGNVFVADGGGSPTAWGGPWAGIEWDGPDQLVVTYDGRSRVFKRMDEVAGVRVDYREAR